ncbi:MAG: alpha/beta fold hydrolase [Pikeienuella sp.]
MTSAAQTAPLHADHAECPTGAEAIWLDAGGTRIRAAFWKGGTRGTALIFTGRTEYIEKYGRVIAAFVQRGFSVVSLDWRGQGLSERACDDPMKGHIERFSEYQADIDALLATPQMADMPGPQVLVCHSMGGCIGMRALVEGRLSPALTIMSGPMLDIELAPHMRIAASLMSSLARRFGRGHAYAPRPDCDKAYVQAEDYSNNMLTYDEGYYDWMRTHLEHDPNLALAGPTLGWMRAAFDEMTALSVAAPPKGPMVMFLGDSEEIVGPKAIRTYAARAPECQLEVLERCKHEAFMETPEVQARVWAIIDEALARTISTT